MHDSYGTYDGRKHEPSYQTELDCNCREYDCEHNLTLPVNVSAAQEIIRRERGPVVPNNSALLERARRLYPNTRDLSERFGNSEPSPEDDIEEARRRR